MRDIHRRLAVMSLAFGLAMDFNQPVRIKKRSVNNDNLRSKQTIDKVIETLVTKGGCFIEHDLYLELKDALSTKLRGQVLFHCDIASRKIFITYAKVTK